MSTPNFTMSPQLSKEDISGPTATIGALFAEGGEEIGFEDEPDIERRVS